MEIINMLSTRRIFFHYLLLVFAGIGASAYFFSTTHNEALLYALQKNYFSRNLVLRIIKYFIAGIILFPCLQLFYSFLAKKLSLGLESKTLKRAFYPFIILLLSLFQVKYPLTTIFFRFIFIVLTGYSIAYLGYCLDIQFFNKGRSRKLVLAVLLCGYIMLFSMLSTRKHQVFKTHAFDLGVFCQTLWGYSQGRNIVNSVVFKPVYLLGDHWSPVSFLLVPFYYLWTDPRLILLIQSIYLGLGVIPLYLLTIKKCKHPGFAMAISMGYFLFPALHGINLADFHYVSMVVPLFFLLLLVNETGNNKWFYILYLLLLFVREDISYHLFFFGIYLLLFSSKKIRGSILVLVSCTWFYLALNVFIPHFNQQDPRFHMGVYDHLGNNVPEIVGNLILHPVNTIKFLARDGIKRLEYICQLSIPVGLGYLVSIKTVFLVIPSFGFNLLSNFRGQYTIKGQYTAPLVPFLFTASVIGYNYLVEITAKKYRLNKSRLYHGISIYLVVAAIISAYYFSPVPFSRDRNFSDYILTDHERYLNELVKTIPSERSVSAQSDIVPHLAHRDEIHVFPVKWEWVDYVILDFYSTCFPLNENKYREMVIKVFNNPGLGLVSYHDGIFLFIRDYPTTKNREAFKAFKDLLMLKRTPGGELDIPKGSYVYKKRPVKLEPETKPWLQPMPSR